MTIQEFIDGLNAKFEGQYYFSIEKPGIKYTRVIQSFKSHRSSRSAFCFVDAEGNIYKPDSWERPAKGVRSTLTTVNLDNVDPYGTWLYQ